MGGEWIKMRKSLPDAPEVIAMAAALGESEEAIAGRWIRVWGWFDEHTTDGHARSVTFVTVDRLARREGFAQAAADVGWLEKTDDGVLVPKFDRHNSESAKKRALASNRQEKARVKSNAPSVTNVTQSELPEKRREEKSNNKTEQRDSGPIQDAAASFLKKWNSTPGTIACPDQFALASPGLLIDRFGDPSWVANYPRALAKFPLKCFSDRASVSWFLKPDTVQEIIAGKFDFTPRAGPNARHAPKRVELPENFDPKKLR
jgi:hypothetical protein